MIEEMNIKAWADVEDPDSNVDSVKTNMKTLPKV